MLCPFSSFLIEFSSTNWPDVGHVGVVGGRKSAPGGASI
jgi:hypothetical protein